MFSRLVPVLLCLAVVTLSSPAAMAQGAAAPSLTILNLTESAVVARDTVTFRLGPQTAPGAAAPAGTCTEWLASLQAQSWQLFVQGTATPASRGAVTLECEGASVVRATARLIFHGLPEAIRTVVEPEERNIWIAFGGRNVQIDVGPAAQAIGPVQTVWVRNTATWQRAVVVGTLLVGTAGFLLLVFGTNIARDPMPPAAVVDGVPCPGDCRPSFSLSRMQFLWWLFIVTMCFMVIVTLTGRTDVVSSETLVLLGIVGGTSLLSVTQDQRKADDENQKRAALVAAYQTLAAMPAASAADTAPTAPAASVRLTGLALDIHNASRNFFDDLLTDANGLSVHRLQMLIWSVVLGVVFMVATMRTMVMPDLDPNLLVLMGISSGTYFGFKINETQVPPAQTGAQPAAVPAPAPAPGSQGVAPQGAAVQPAQ